MKKLGRNIKNRKKQDSDPLIAENKVIILATKQYTYKNKQNGKITFEDKLDKTTVEMLEEDVKIPSNFDNEIIITEHSKGKSFFYKVKP